MCHIITAISNKLIGKTMADKVIGASYVAYENNDDMEGMYCSHLDAAAFSLNKSTFSEIADAAARSKMVMYHARRSTSGLTIDNVQPFVEDGFVFAHNGIYSIKPALTNKNESDSKIVFKAFLTHVKTNDVPTAYQLAIETVCDAPRSFSTFIYDIANGVLWYTKSATTSMTAYILDNTIIFTTRKVTSLVEGSTSTYTIRDNNWYYVDTNKSSTVLYDGGAAVYAVKEPAYENRWGWDNDARMMRPMASFSENKKKEELDDLEKAWKKEEKLLLESERSQYEYDPWAYDEYTGYYHSRWH